MKIGGLITVISISVIPARTLQLSNLSPKTTNLSALELPIFTYCNASESWLPKHTSADDLYTDCCAATLAFLGIATEHGNTLFEFHAADVQQRYKLPSKTTPIKHIYGSCIILIANLHSLPLERLPLFAHQNYPATASASYVDVFDAVDSVMASCMESGRMERRLGWAVQGRPAAGRTRGGLGVFLIGKDSEFDRAVPVVSELDIGSDRGRQAGDASL